MSVFTIKSLKVVSLVCSWVLLCSLGLTACSGGSDSSGQLGNQPTHPPGNESGDQEKDQERAKDKAKKSEEDKKAKGTRLAEAVGLPNLGNSCYMNSALKYLLYTPGLVDSLEQRGILNPQVGPIGDFRKGVVELLSLLRERQQESENEAQAGKFESLDSDLKKVQGLLFNAYPQLFAVNRQQAPLDVWNLLHPEFSDQRIETTVRGTNAQKSTFFVVLTAKQGGSIQSLLDAAGERRSYSAKDRDAFSYLNIQVARSKGIVSNLEISEDLKFPLLNLDGTTEVVTMHLRQVLINPAGHVWNYVYDNTDGAWYIHNDATVMRVAFDHNVMKEQWAKDSVLLQYVRDGL